MKKLTETAHEIVLEALRRGTCAVDATVGNGFDTVFLARNVGLDGLVIGLDVQATALARARECLRLAEVLDRTRLIHDGHENMERYVHKLAQGRPVTVCMFNLGYLPRSDRAVVTKPATTLRALDSAVGLLSDGGIISVIAYSGHPGGSEEAVAVRDWIVGLSRNDFLVSRMAREGSNVLAPELTIIERRTVRQCV